MTRGESGGEVRLSDADVVLITIRGEALTFTNSRLHNSTIGFEPHPVGSFDEISSTGDEGASVSIQGRIVGDAIEADVADSVCEHHWHVVRTGRHDPHRHHDLSLLAPAPEAEGGRAGGAGGSLREKEPAPACEDGG